MFGEKIDIATPKAYEMDFKAEEVFRELLADEPDNALVTISFALTIGNLIDSQIMQALPIGFAQQMAQKIYGNATGMGDDLPEPIETSSEPEIVFEMAAPYSSAPEPAPMAPPPPPPQAPVQQVAPEPPPAQAYAPPPPGYAEGPAPMYYAPPPGYAPPPPRAAPNVNAQPVQFQSFDYEAAAQQKENIGILMDVPLDVSVELGKTSKKIKEILEFSPGTIIELDKLAGEPIDILVNGKYVAKGEVVVIDENFAIRVTSIINAELRI
jgi:flagellar motor switch protein FliN/FliY